MIEWRNNFNLELNEICETIKISSGKLTYEKAHFDKCYFEQSSNTEENIDAMEYVGFGDFMQCVYKDKYIRFQEVGIKGTNIPLSEIAYSSENEKIVDILCDEFPELSREQIKAAQRVITVILLGFQCRELGKLYQI